MTKSFRIGVLGLTHDHVWDVLKDLRDTSRATLVAAADPHGPLRDRVQREHGCAVHADYDALLERESLDAVFIYGDNAAGARLAEQAAGRGLHVLIEKPMAADLRGADRALAAARRAGVRLMVNWPFAWWPQLQHALHLATSGDLGDVWQVRYRAAHAGPRELGCSSYFCDWLYDPKRNGGGALMDYCCYGAALACCVLGLPSRVTAVAGRLCKDDIPVEDNAVLVMTYARAMAMAEGSWTQAGNLTSYQAVLYGTRATLVVEPRAGGRLLRASHDQPAGAEVPVPPLPAERRTASSCFLHGLETGEPFPRLCQDRIGRDAQEVLEAGLLSVARGASVSLPLWSCAAEGTAP
jgi:predicted dehydrogenase